MDTGQAGTGADPDATQPQLSQVVGRGKCSPQQVILTSIAKVTLPDTSQLSLEERQRHERKGCGPVY